MSDCCRLEILVALGAIVTWDGQRQSIRPSGRTGLGQPPYPLSNPLRLRMILMSSGLPGSCVLGRPSFPSDAVTQYGDVAPRCWLRSEQRGRAYLVARLAGDQLQ